jgi:hypothetical protein
MMVKNMIVRGFDDKTHADLAELARRKGVSVNSIMKDAVDKWLQQQSTAPKKHHLVLYDNDESMISLLRSMDKLAKDNEWFRCYAGPPSSRQGSFLAELGWFDGTILPYRPHDGNVAKYCGLTMEKIVKAASDRQVCCTDFLINDIAKNSLKHAMKIEHAYDNDRIAGFMFCTYKTETLLDRDNSSIVDLFAVHDQVFIINNDDVFKLHMTRENVHKLFLG